MLRSENQLRDCIWWVREPVAIILSEAYIRERLNRQNCQGSKLERFNNKTGPLSGFTMALCDTLQAAESALSMQVSSNGERHYGRILHFFGSARTSHANVP